MTLQIRRAALGDALALARMRYEFRVARGTPCESADQFVDRCRRWIEERLAVGPWRCWVAAHDGQIIGNVWVEYIEKIPNPLPERERHAYLTNFYVREAMRGAGVGSRLLAGALDDCRRQEVHAVLLWPTERSQPLYARHGFVSHGPIMYLDLAPG